MTTQPTGAPFPAATVMLIRDGSDGLEVFMVIRHHQIDFAAGAMVFPGGRVDAADVDPGLHRWCAGVARLDGVAVGLRVAAIREAFEECGVLLARSGGTRDLVSGARVAPLSRVYRAPLAAARTTIRELVERERLELACDVLIPFAHWITPALVPKRFDTHFFLAAAPLDQMAVHDGHESVDSLWITPQRALEEADRGTRTVIPPTRMNLGKLARYQTVVAALEGTRDTPVVTVIPQFDPSVTPPVLRIPAEAGYGVTEIPIDDPRGK